MNPRLVACVFIAAMLLAACASNGPAPLIERSPILRERSPAALATADEPRPGYYTVKKGDTLYGIALEHGQDYKDIAAWNYLDDPNLIKAGQQLRVEPQDGAAPVAETRPVAAPAAVESRPLGSSATVTSTATANTDTYKREPKAGAQPYSDQAWAQRQQPETPPPAARPIEQVAPPPVANNEMIDWSWPASGKVIAPYAEGANKGIDIAGKTGQSVFAAAAGKITLVSNALRGYGNLVVVKHNTTYLSVYAHNSRILVKEGDSVAKGQPIAEIGSSDADQPQLHFEIRRQGKPVDPAQFLPKR